MKIKMYKHIIVALFLSLLVLMTGCAQINEKTDELAEQISVSGNPKTDIADYSLKTVFYNTGKNPINYGAITTDGYYSYISRRGVPYDKELGETGNGNITYIDFSTARRMYLCNIPGCAHNEISCSSFVTGWGGGILFPDYNEKHILFLREGKMDDVVTENHLGKIESMDRDGNKRRLVYKLGSKESFSSEDCIFVDSTSIYVAVITIDANENGFIKELRKIDIETSKSTIILSTTMDSIFCECFDNKILMLKYQSSPMLYYTIDVMTGEVEEVYSGQGAVLTYSHYMVWAHNNGDGTGELELLDILDGTRRVFGDIPCYPGKSIMIDNFYGDVIEWSFVLPPPEEETITFFVNTQTGVYNEKKLMRRKYSDYDFYTPVGIIGETGDGRFLVTQDAKTCEVTFFDYLGVPCTITYPNTPSFALITKDDYYAGIPNYQYIDDKVYETVA